MNSYWGSKKLSLIVIVMLVLLLSACGSENSAQQDLAAPATDSNAAVMEELKLLRGELAVMREAIKDIHRRTMSQPSGGKAVAKASAPLASEIKLVHGARHIGSDNATLAIMEFSDYQCPYCERFHKRTFDLLKQQYVDTGKVKYFFHDYPLDFHAEARPAAIAANCAGEQDKFLAMHDALFDNMRKLGAELYPKLAKETKLNEAQFSQCFKDGRAADKIESDLLYAQSLGVRGTPTFFIGRIVGDKLVDTRRLVGAQSLGSFKKILDSQLASLGQPSGG